MPLPVDRAGSCKNDDTHGAVLISLELSRSKWLVTSLSPGTTKMSKHVVPGGDAGALLTLLMRLREKATRACGICSGVVAIHEAGLDGFWVHRLLALHEVESHVVEPASIAVPRRHRRVKTDAIDGEVLLRTLMAFRRGEPRVCSMVVPPSPEDEDRRRIARERKTLVKERTEHVNRIKGLLYSQRVSGYQPLGQNARVRLDSLSTGDGRPLPSRLKAEIRRELERIDLVQSQIAAVEKERDALVQPATDHEETPGSLLMRLRGIGPEFAAVLWMEGLHRSFANRRQLAAYAGLAPSPWQSGTVRNDQGIARSGNPRLRATLVELAWLWLRYQPDSALSRWFQERVKLEKGRVRRVMIVALARRLLVALWRFTTRGEIPEGAQLKPA